MERLGGSSNRQKPDTEQPAHNNAVISPSVLMVMYAQWRTRSRRGSADSISYFQWTAQILFFGGNHNHTLYQVLIFSTKWFPPQWNKQSDTPLTASSLKPKQRSAPKCLFGTFPFPLLLFAVLATVAVSVVRLKPLWTIQHSCFGLKNPKCHCAGHTFFSPAVLMRYCSRAHSFQTHCDASGKRANAELFPVLCIRANELKVAVITFFQISQWITWLFLLAIITGFDEPTE